MVEEEQRALDEEEQGLASEHEQLRRAAQVGQPVSPTGTREEEAAAVAEGAGGSGVWVRWCLDCWAGPAWWRRRPGGLDSKWHRPGRYEEEEEGAHSHTNPSDC